MKAADGWWGVDFSRNKLSIDGGFNPTLSYYSTYITLVTLDIFPSTEIGVNLFETTTELYRVYKLE